MHTLAPWFPFIREYNAEMGNAWVPQSIPGLYMVGQPVMTDLRGAFHKVLCETPAGVSVPTLKFEEMYWSTSEEGVFRGMHLQVPPYDGRKFVFVTAGTVTDYVVDLRVGSPTFTHVWQSILSPESRGVLIPAGCAHGFHVHTGPAVMVYAQEGYYRSEFDTGVNVVSMGIDVTWKAEKMSERDQLLPTIAEFDSPFTFNESEYSRWVLNP